MRDKPALTHAQLRLVQVGFALVVLAYFVRFVAPGLQAGFNIDDPMNIHSFWSRGAGELVRNLVLFFTTYGRPMGGVYFSVLYHFFGLNPFPYHVALTGLLLLNTFLAYRFARLVTGSQLAAGLTALPIVYHAQMPQLVYMPALVFDVLCFTFYFSALVYYLSIRTRGVQLNVGQTAVFLALYVCALDSKEMAVTLPAIVLLYEAIWRPAGRKWAPAVGGVLLTLVYVLGKAFGSDSWIKLAAYRPEFTWSRYWESTTRFVNAVFSQPIHGGFFTAGRVALLAAILLCVAWRSRQKHLLLMWFFLWIAPLPITFIPDRGGPNLYIPVLGWAMVVASVFVWLAGIAVRSRALRWAPAPVALGVIVTLGMAAFWVKTEREDRQVSPDIRNPGQLTWSVIQQVRAVQPSVPPGSRIYVVRGPFDGWDMKFIMELVYHDRSVHVWLGEQTPLPPERIEQMDYVFTFENGKLIRLKGV